MTRMKLVAAAAILSSVIATPVLAQDMTQRSMRSQSYDHTAYDRRDTGFWPADTAAGIVGGVVGTAGAIATAPFRGSYAYDQRYNDTYGGQSYAQRNGFVCQPGTLFRGEDGHRHICQ
ncbi:hypothetical protein [Tardiphaga sp.]|uniref:hypothetical protein n=1 Tax=Tardiphaga sp. TaxID=1926292 RepID=UPI002622F9D1|nr:hypothetical protein [Tardiphaga sp.]MDB5616232.1 hypothetical protein [Tardiphaga sp.]